MTSLSEAYERRIGERTRPRRLYLALGLFVSGALLTAVGVLVATTDVLAAFGLDRMAAWRRAGVLAGLGVPALVAGVFVVLPSSRRIKGAAAIGASLSVLGVALFWYAYPAHWAGYGQNLTLPVTSVYFLGMTTSVWCLFVGIANLKQRNDPGGTVSLKVTENGGTRVIEVARSELGNLGGIGTLGSDPDGNVATQTGPASSGTGGGVHTGGTGGGAAAATTTGVTSDGGIEDNEITSLGGEDAVISSTDSARKLADRYCGNCEHFQYVRSEQGMEPYCGLHADSMEDMEACDEWEPNH